MAKKKKKHPKVKSKLHRRNKHKSRYDLQALIQSCPELKPFVILNNYDDESIDFFDPAAVKMLNTALLKHYYDIEFWDIPKGYLCPPIPGRADYLHYVADILSLNYNNEIPKGKTITCLDVGVGANCVYPIIGVKEYNWTFIASDSDPTAVKSAKNIVKHNSTLKNKVDIRFQAKKNQFFEGVLKEGERIDITICNPPFHSSQEEAKAASMRKAKNLSKNKDSKVVLNFGGRESELWCVGGEEKFISDMIRESKTFSNSCLWFSSLVSKHTTLKALYRVLENSGAIEAHTLKTGQGNKISRILAWTFHKPEEQAKWATENW